MATPWARSPGQQSANGPAETPAANIPVESPAVAERRVRVRLPFVSKLAGVATTLLAMNTAGAALLLAVSLAGIAVPPSVHADCGDPAQPPCAGPVPSIDQVVAIMAELTDPSKPAADKTDVVTPGFTPDEAQTIDDHLDDMNRRQILPFDFVVTDIQPAPAHLAGATLGTAGGYKHATYARPIVLADQGGHWLITHDTAVTELDVFWRVSHKRIAVVVP